MILSQISEIFFLQLAVGISLCLPCVKSERLGKGFYILNTVMAVVSAGLAILFALTKPDLHRAFALPPLVGMTVFLLLAAIIQARGGQRWTRWLFCAFALGAFTLCAEVRTLAPQVLDVPLLNDVLRIAPFILGSVLLSGAVVGMNLGHWYLISKGLPFNLLENMSRIFIMLVLARVSLLLITLGLFYFLPGTGRGALGMLFAPEGYLIFFLMRVLWGLLGPFVLGVMVFRCVEIQSNTSATGLMYVVVVSLLIGELLASYLTVLSAVPV